MITPSTILSIPVAVLLLVPAWRLFQRAGLPPLLSLLILVPTVGVFVVAGILAFARWRNDLT